MKHHAQRNPEVDEYFKNVTKWRDELKQLRAIALECPLTEEFKWRQPCYTFQEKNILIISAFKEYCALNFFMGALLKDPQGILVQPGENTQAGRQMRFTSLSQIIEREPLIKAYVNEAVEAAKAGVKVDYKKTKEYKMPEELQSKFKEDPALQTAFEKLTPGRRRAYLLHFSAPKQSKTRQARIEKSVERILKGKGFNDCICGLTQKPPYCDGSHKGKCD